MVSGVTYEEPMLLFRNTGNGFENVSKQSGPIFSKPIPGRGLAVGDFDNDGSVDVLVAVGDGAPILLRNNAGRQNHWLGVRLIGRKSNIDAVGAKVTYRSGDFQRALLQVWRWRLFGRPRPASCAGSRAANQDGLARGEMAAAGRYHRALHQSTPRPIHHYRRRGRKVEIMDGRQFG